MNQYSKRVKYSKRMIKKVIKACVNHPGTKTVLVLNNYLRPLSDSIHILCRCRRFYQYAFTIHYDNSVGKIEFNNGSVINIRKHENISQENKIYNHAVIQDEFREVF